MKAFLQFLKTLFFKPTLAASFSAVFLLFFLLSASSSWGQIAQRGSSTTASSATTNNTTITIDKPSGVVAGDVLLFSVVQNETDNDNGGLTSPTLSGWTLVKDRLIRSEGTADGNNAWFGSIYYRVAGDSEGGSFTFAMNSLCDMAIGSMVAFSGVACNALQPNGSAGGPFDIVPGDFAIANSATATATGVNVANNNSAVIMFAMCNNDRTYGSWSNLQSELFDNITTNGDDASVGAAWLSSVNSGATGDRTVTLSAIDRNSAILLVLRRATTMTVGTASSTPTLCVNAALTNITHTTTGATGIGTATGLPAGVSAAWASNIITISGSPTQSGTFSYSIPLVGSCAPVNATGTITVTAANTAAAASSTPTLCINTALTNITHTTTSATGIGTATGLPSGVTAAWASNTITISGTPTASGTFNYSIPLTGGCGSVNATGTITVSAAPSAGTLSGTQAICSNGTTTLTSSVSGGTWTSGSTGVATIGASTGVVTGVAAGTATMTYTVTGTGGCANATATRTVTVTAAPSAGTLSGTQELCSNGTTTLSSSVSGGTWSSGSTGIATINASTGVVTGVAAGTATMTYTVTGAGGCANATATRVVTVNFVPTVTGALVCAGGSGSLLVTSSCEGTPGGETSGPRNAGTGANLTGVGSTAWSNPGNITAVGTPYATVNPQNLNASNYLKASNYGFSIPDNAIINGIQLTISRSSDRDIVLGTTYGNRDNLVSLVKNNNVESTNKAVAGVYPSSLTNQTYGSATDLWGSTWTPADINNANFGAALSVFKSSIIDRTATVDFMQITVTYTIPGTLNWYTVSSGGTSIGSGSNFNPVAVANSGLANTNSAGTTSYWVECTTAVGGCRAKADFVIKPSGSWIGAVSTDWNNDGNWCGTGAPNKDKDATIPNEPTRQPIISSADAAVRSLIIESGAQLTINSSRNLEVWGNWTNNGSFTATSGSVNFKKADGVQAIGGANVSTFNNISIEGGGEKAISKDVEINGAVTFTNGYITSGSSSKLIFRAGSSVASGAGAAKDASFAKVQVVKFGTTEFEFPVGGLVNSVNKYRPIRISNLQNTSATDFFTAEHVASNPLNSLQYNTVLGSTRIYKTETPISETLTSISNFEYWNLSRSNASSVVNVTMDWSVYPTSNANAQFLRMGHYDATPSNRFWENAPNAGARSFDVATKKLTVTNVNSFSPFAIASIQAAALPVTLSSFTAKPTPDNKVSLAWVTSTEQVNKGFRIERQAGNENGKFEQIGFVGSKAKDGNSQNMLTYNFIDAAPKVGAASFYRLVQEDLDGKLTYTEVRVVKLIGQSVSMVFPNPSNGAVNISRTADGKKMNIQVIDQSGRIISQVNNVTDANYRMNISHSGVYTIKMTYPETGEQSIQRIVVQK